MRAFAYGGFYETPGTPKHTHAHEHKRMKARRAYLHRRDIERLDALRELLEVPRDPRELHRDGSSSQNRP